MMKRQPERRHLLRGGLLVAGGFAGGVTIDRLWGAAPIFPREAKAARPGKVDARLEKLGITLPTPPKPIAVYVPAVRVGNLIYTSGHGPMGPDGKLMEGRVGEDLTLEQGKAAARLVGVGTLASLKATLGDLDRVVRLVKVLGMVNATASFKRHPEVINGFSELMVEVFGERQGVGARSAVGMASLPGNIPVEIEAIFEVR